MMHRRRDERASRAEEIFNAHMARHEARITRSMAVHERAMAAAELRVAGAMGAHERAMEAVERRVEDVLRRARAIRPDMPRGAPFKGRGGERRPDEEGGDPVPAIPRPKPKPLAGAAAAPIE